MDETRENAPYFRHAAVFALFLLLAVIFLLPESLHLGEALLGYPGDNFQHAWFLWHFARAVSHAQNPFFTSLIFYPNQVNLAWSTTDPLAAILALPLSVTTGAIVAYNVSLILQLALAAFFAYLLCMRICGNLFAALIGGVCFGFSPFLTGEALGHLSLVTAFPIPLYFLALDSALGGTERVARRGVKLGLALFLTAMAHYNFTVFCVLLTVVVLAVDMAMDGVGLVMKRWKALTIGALTFGVLFTPFFWAMWSVPGARPQSRATELIEGHSADALGWFVPGWHHLLFGRLSRAWNAGLFGAGYEGTVYLGPTILLLVGVGIWAGLRDKQDQTARRWTIRAAAAALVFAALSLGPHVHVWGHATSLAGPALLFYHSPFAKYVSAPARFHVVATLCFAVLVSMGATFLMNKLSRGAARAALATVICAVLALDLLTLPFPTSTSAASERYAGFAIPIEGCHVPADVNGSTVVTIPELEWPYPVRAMWMQVRDEGRYALADGYVSYGPDSTWDEFWKIDVLRSLRAVQAGDDQSIDVAADRATFPEAKSKMNLGAFVVFDFSRRDATVAYLQSVLGQPGERQVTCTLFDLHTPAPSQAALF